MSFSEDFKKEIATAREEVGLTDELEFTNFLNNFLSGQKEEIQLIFQLLFVDWLSLWDASSVLEFKYDKLDRGDFSEDKLNGERQALNNRILKSLKEKKSGQSSNFSLNSRGLNLTA